MIESAKEQGWREILSPLGLIVVSIFGGLIAGAIFGLAGSFIYLVIAFPIAMGFAARYVITEGIKQTKVRKTTVIILASVLTAIALYGAYHYMRYVGLQVMVAFKSFGDFSDRSLEAGKLIVDLSLEDTTGQRGFTGYLLFKARQGVSIGRIFSGNSLNLGPIFTWLYWIVELGIITYLTVNAGMEFAKKPFCETCKSWYPGQDHIGGLNIGKEKEVLDFMRRRDFAGVRQLFENSTQTPSFEFYLQSCNTCDKSPSFLYLSKAQSTNGKLALSTVIETTLTPRERQLLG